MVLNVLSEARRQRMVAASLQERYERGAFLFHQGQRSEWMWIIQKGWVHLVRSSTSREAAEPVVLFTITPDEALCGISAIAHARYNVSGMAATTCDALRIPAEEFREAVKQESAFAFEVVRLCTRRIRHIAEQYGTMAEPVPHRLVRTMLRLQRQFGNRLPVTHRELAQMSWTTTESAIRTVRRLKHQGYLTGERGRVTIEDLSGLQAFVDADGLAPRARVAGADAHGRSEGR